MIGITRLAEWWQTVILRDRLFCPIFTYKNLSQWSPIGIMRHGEWWQMVILRDRLFYPILTWLFFLLIIEYCIFIFKKKVSRIPDYSVTRHIMIMSLLHNSDITCLTKCVCSIFIFPDKFTLLKDTTQWRWGGSRTRNPSVLSQALYHCAPE